MKDEQFITVVRCDIGAIDKDEEAKLIKFYTDLGHKIHVVHNAPGRSLSITTEVERMEYRQAPWW